MEVVTIERSTYEELLTNFNSFVAQMKEMASRGKDKRLNEWLDNQDVCQILNVSPRTLQTLRDNGTLAYSQIESFGTVAFHVPHRKWNTHLATELRLSSVDCHTSHYRDNPVLLLTLVHVEQNLECAS